MGNPSNLLERTDIYYNVAFEKVVAADDVVPDPKQLFVRVCVFSCGILPTSDWVHALQAERKCAYFNSLPPMSVNGRSASQRSVT